MEEGELTYADTKYAASRKYIYVPRKHFVEVSYDDRRPFYTIDCDDLPQASFQHLCGEDHYEGSMTLEERAWSLSWRVTGPAKDLRITTRYT